ncbi:MAG: response regulator [Candidatus Woesearchaeota archaeon]|nr:response regulator [Candidatus Woesearchaeota archaeon]
MARKILIIEDEKHISNLLKFILEKKGFIIEQAFLGEEGLEKIDSFHPDLILLDVMMPKMDGFEVLENMSNIEKAKGIPVIMLSSAAQLRDKEKGLSVGATEYMTKPFDKDKLLGLITKYID